MTDIEIPDNEEAACDLDKIEAHFVSRGRYPDAEFVAGAARRLRADAEEIARLEAKVWELSNIALAHYSLQAHYGMLESDLAAARTEAAAQRELATLLESDSPDPLTRIAAALERPSREWVAVGIHRALVAQEGPVSINRVERIAWAIAESDALLAEMGEG